MISHKYQYGLMFPDKGVEITQSLNSDEWFSKLELPFNGCKRETYTSVVQCGTPGLLRLHHTGRIRLGVFWKLGLQKASTFNHVFPWIFSCFEGPRTRSNAITYTVLDFRDTMLHTTEAISLVSVVRSGNRNYKLMMLAARRGIT